DPASSAGLLWRSRYRCGRWTPTSLSLCIWDRRASLHDVLPLSAFPLVRLGSLTGGGGIGPHQSRGSTVGRLGRLSCPAAAGWWSSAFPRTGGRFSAGWSSTRANRG